MKKNILNLFQMVALVCVLIFTFMTPFSSSSVEAYTLKGWKFPYNMSYKTTSSYSYINSAWSTAASVWNGKQSYRDFYSAPGSTNYLTDEYTTSSARYGVMTTTFNSSNEVTKFYGRLNRSYYDIRNNANVRKSSAVHELGHALGLGHSSAYAVMNTSRDRKELTEPTFDDLNGIDAIY